MTKGRIAVERDGAVGRLIFDSPARCNAVSHDMWRDAAAALEDFAADKTLRVLVVTGAGRKAFSAGDDITDFAAGRATGEAAGTDARAGEKALHLLDTMPCPTIAMIRGYCIGGGVDMVTACDMRYCSVDAQFSIKEIDMGMAADVGTLQRLPRIIGDGIMRELAFTGRNVEADEALRIGLVNRVYDDQAALMDGVFAIAREIAAKSPIAVAGTKEMLSYMRDHRIDDGLDYIATWNAAMLQSEDLRVAVAAHMSKQKPTFAD